MKKLLPLLSNLWANRSEREQQLALGVAVLLIAMSLLTGVRGALATLRDMNGRIGQLQQDLVNYHFQLARKIEVDKQYSLVAAQHSSKWSAAEIHDRLRQEIYRLAQKTPPDLNNEGIPLRGSSTQENLVEIPALQEGTLRAGGEGYREYSLALQVPSAEWSAMVNFIERLQSSPQSLRIDGLELNRNALNTKVGATFHITRTIVDGGGPEPADKGNNEVGVAKNTGSSPTAVPTESAAEITVPPLKASEWNADNAKITPPAEGQSSLAANATAAEARFYKTQTAKAGQGYDLFVEAAATGPARLAVSDASGAKIFDGATPMKTDGKTYRYHVQFTPGGNGETALRAPLFLMDAPDTKITIERMLVIPMAG